MIWIKLFAIAVLTAAFMLLGCDGYLNGPIDQSCQGVEDLRDCTP